MTFTDEDYRYPIAELKKGKPESDDWELFVDTPEIQVWALLDPVTGYFEWKVFGQIEYSTKILQHVLFDLNYRREWDSYADNIEKISDEGSMEIIYWDVNYGLPFVSNRDYVYCRESKQIEEDGCSYTVFLSKTYNAKEEIVGVKKSKIRVEGFKQYIAMVDTSQGCKLMMHSVDRPGGSIPKRLINWAARTGIPNYLEKLKKICQKSS